MTAITSTTTMIEPPFEREAFDEAQLAAASFVARYIGRTFEAYRHDLTSVAVYVNRPSWGSKLLKTRELVWTSISQTMRTLKLWKE